MTRAVHPLADDYVTACESPDAVTVFCYSPGLAKLPGGRPDFCRVSGGQSRGTGIAPLCQLDHRWREPARSQPFRRRTCREWAQRESDHVPYSARLS